MPQLRIAHIADTHLGYRSATVGGRDEDFALSWLAACRAIVEARPQIILHAGDVFHHPNPSWGAVSHFLDGATLLKSAGCPIFMISGNHDSSRLPMKHTIFSVLPGVVPHITISHDPEPVMHRLEDMDTDIVLLSHRALVNPSLKENLERMIHRLDAQRNAILVSHGSVGDLTESQEMGSVVIPDFIFKYPWSYIALGHLHNAQPFGPNGWYSGSTERCGWSDYPATPGWTFVSLTPDGVRHDQRSVPHLQMLELPDLHCASFADAEICEHIIESLVRHRMVDARILIRVLLKGIHPSRQRALRTSSQRSVKDRYPSVLFQLTVENSASLLRVDREDTPMEKMQSLEDMFRDYVLSRTFVDPDFGDRFLQRGLTALDKVHDAVAEGDTGDERSVPVG